MCCARFERGAHACATLLAIALLASGLCGVARGELSILTYNIYYGGQPHDPVLDRDHEWLRVI